MHPRERLDYSPIDRRPPLRFPQGVRLVVWPLIALEEWRANGENLAVDTRARD